MTIDLLSTLIPQLTSVLLQNKPQPFGRKKTVDPFRRFSFSFTNVPRMKYSELISKLSVHKWQSTLCRLFLNWQTSYSKTNLTHFENKKKLSMLPTGFLSHSQIFHALSTQNSNLNFHHINDNRLFILNWQGRTPKRTVPSEGRKNTVSCRNSSARAVIGPTWPNKSNYGVLIGASRSSRRIPRPSEVSPVRWMYRGRVSARLSLLS